MSRDQSYPFPEVFLVDGGGGPQSNVQTPRLVPCWSFPPAQERARGSKRDRGCMGVSPGLLMVLLLLLLLVFAALGLGAYQIQKLKTQLAKMEKVRSFYEPVSNEENTDNRPAAHVIGRLHSDESRKTLKWEPHAGRAFTSGGVVYRVEDGALQVNETGLYHIYSRVEWLFNQCPLPEFIVHSMFVRRARHPLPLPLMEGRGTGHCKEGRGWTSESYLGSALQLQKQDRVFVNVSYPTYLSHKHHAIFFGLYKI
uniref:Fas ligand (TNF superfamily, member 6) n=1 Tax=Myripristis murdjan TaxID=586833 RepID=A0A667YT34_9TELE